MAETERKRIRILNGPLRGVTHVVGTRVGIGRASSSDIQLVHDGISRQHAQIVTDEHGQHVLVDLDSSNGTFIEGQRIRRQILSPDTEFKIMRVKLVYEIATEDEVDCEDSGVFAVHRVDGETLRGTVDYGGLDLPRPAGSKPSRRTTPPAPPPVVSGAPVPRQSHPSSGVAAVQGRTEERHRVVATRPDGSTYEGSLVDDVVDYRNLRTRFSRGDDMLVEDHDNYRSLESRLRQPDDNSSEGRREYVRFQCNFPAKLRFSDGTELVAAVLDMGVDGAKLRVYDHQIEHDAIIWLAIHLVSRGRALTVVFTSRVVWTCKDHVGLGFAGTADWEQRGHRKIEVRTHMELGDQVRAARKALGRMKVGPRRPPSGAT